MVSVLISENMCLPKVSGGSLLADGRGRGDPERLAESKRLQRSDRTARAVAKIRRTTGTNPEEHRGRERSSERFRIEQRHRFSRFTGETRRSEHQVLDDTKIVRLPGLDKKICILHTGVHDVTINRETQ